MDKFLFLGTGQEEERRVYIASGCKEPPHYTLWFVLFEKTGTCVWGKAAGQSVGKEMVTTYRSASLWANC